MCNSIKAVPHSLFILSTQIAAQRLAICNDIGEASYIDSMVAAALIIRCKLLPSAPQLLQVGVS